MYGIVSIVKHYDVVIVGAGHAGCAVATHLREYGFDGTILLIGEEPVLPYRRPPLSKARLTPHAEPEPLELYPASVYADRRIELLLCSRVEAADVHARCVELADGTRVGWRRLVLATGAAPVVPPLPGVELPQVHVLRDLQDAAGLAAAFAPRRRLVVVGGGWLGLEVAATARGFGTEVTVVEARSQVVARVAGAEVASFLERYHRSQGVVVRTDAQVQAINGMRQGRTAAVQLSDGTQLECDAVLLAVGASPRDALAGRAGLVCDGGIPVDMTGATAIADVYAIGDVTVRPVPQYGLRTRLESVHSANEQARHAAAAICGATPRRPETPWFWSDQFDLKIQIAGLRAEADTAVVRGEPRRPGFAVFHVRGDRLRAVEAVNAPREFALGRKLISEDVPVSASALADSAVPLRDAVVRTDTSPPG